MTLEAARHAANASRKAGFLFARGYRAERVTPEAVTIRTPAGGAVTVRQADRSCTCTGWKENGFCSHVMGYAKLIWDQAYGGNAHG